MLNVIVDGAVKLNVEIEEREIKTWDADRISHFFCGIADILNAIKGKELHEPAPER